jgi:anti-anti-sigma factor
MAELESDRGAELTIERQTDPTGVPVVSVAGELDISNAAALEAEVESVTSQGPGQVIFELSGLRYMDSAGISVLLRAAANVEEVRLRSPSEAVQRIVTLTGLADVLRTEP